MNEKKLHLLTGIIAVAALLPLVLVNTESWDTVLAELGYRTQDWSAIRPWLLDLGWYGPYYLYRLFNELSLLTGIPPKVFPNALCVLSILGIARKVFRLLRERYGTGLPTAHAGAWTVLCFPVWHIFISSAVFVNIVCLWLFLVAARLWYRSKPLAAVFFLLSVQLFSVFAFAVGFAAADFLLTVTRENFRSKVLRTVLFCAGLVVLFLVFQQVVSVHGTDGNYNTFNLEQLDSVVQYSLTAGALLLLTVLLAKRLRDPREAETLIRRMAAVLTLMLFAGLAYWAVGRPLRFFAFGSFGARHAILMCVPLGLFVGILCDFAARRVNATVILRSALAVCAILLVLLYQGYDHKIAAVLYSDMLSQAFATIPPPPSGYVVVTNQGFEPPRHLHSYEVNMALYKAYGRAAWMCNGVYEKQLGTSREALQKYYKGTPQSRKLYIAGDADGEAYTRFVFQLKDFHQEGRIWYWLYHLLGRYDAFEPRLTQESP